MLNSAFLKVMYMGTYIDPVGKLLYGSLMNLMRILRSFVLVHGKYLCWCSPCVFFFLLDFWPVQILCNMHYMTSFSAMDLWNQMTNIFHISKSINSVNLSIGSDSQVECHKRGYNGFLLCMVPNTASSQCVWYVPSSGLMEGRPIVLCQSSVMSSFMQLVTLLILTKFLVYSLKLNFRFSQCFSVKVKMMNF